MRIMISAGLAALCVASAASIGSAASLSGKPFPIDPEVDGPRVFASAFALGEGFGVSLAEDSGDDQSPDRLFFKTFAANGEVAIKKALVAKATSGVNGAAFIVGAGGIEISSDKTFVGYVDNRASNGGAATGGLFAQAMAGRKPSGKEIALDDAKTDYTPSGFILPMADGRGLAAWTTFDARQGTISKGRFVLTNGDVGPVDVNLTRKDSTLSGISPLGDGFVALQRDFNADFTKVDIFGQIHDAQGKRSGDEHALAKGASAVDTGALTVTGLQGGDLVVLNVAGGRLTGQIYDAKWKKIGKQTLLVKNPGDGLYHAAALPGGDFVVATTSGKGGATRIEFRRFGRNLKQAGETAKTKPAEGLSVTQMLPLRNGDVVALYAAKDRKLKGQIVKP